MMYFSKLKVFLTYFSVWMQIPSSNKNLTAKDSMKKVMLAFSNTPNSKLNLQGPLKHLFWWNCVAPNASKDVCIRPAGAGVHPLVAHMLLTCCKLPFQNA